MEVADAFIGELVERLVQVAKENTRFSLGIKDEIYNLVDDLKLFKADLKKASAHENANRVLEDVVDKILNVVNDAEDAICKYNTEKRKHTAKGRDSYSGFAKEINSIRSKVKQIQQDYDETFQDLSVAHRGNRKLDAGALLNEIERLEHVLDENVSLKGTRDEMQDMLMEVRSFRAYMNEAASYESAYDSEIVKYIAHNIRNVLLDAIDMIDMLALMRKKYKDKGALRYLGTLCYCAKVKDVARGIRALRDRHREIRQDCAHEFECFLYSPNTVSALPRMLKAPIPAVVEEDVVGFNNEVKIIKNRVLGGSKHLTVISIVGMVGLGKTTFTKMVFMDCDVQNEFSTRLWVYVSRIFRRRQIFQDILSDLTMETVDEFHDMSNKELAEKIKELLRDKKYLVVMDDIWWVKDWDLLKIAFANNEKGSRVLVTTQDARVASHAASNYSPHQLKFLEDEESWELLKRKVFGKEECPPQLENYGKRIAKQCNGLPLAVVVIAGVLAKDCSASAWKRVAHDPFPVINRENLSYNAVVKLRYDHLPSYLKDCFLYLATFPKGHEISAWKLISLWIAEGFIQDGYGDSRLEHTAKKYLEDMVDRNLVMVLKRRADGQIKTCGIHNTLHEFCRTEATNRNLFQEMNGAKLEVNNIISRRLCVYSNILELLRSENYYKQSNGGKVRSFLSSYSKESEVEIPNELLAAIPKSFPLLRVMDVEYLKFSMLPDELYHLYHLRFLAVSITDMKLLPKLFNNLWNMQTLVFKSSQNSLEVEADIWSMSKLRHVHSNCSMVLPPPLKSSKNNASVSTDIKTLSTISPSSCTGDIFDKTPDLQKLGIRGNLAELMDVKQGGVSLFDNLQKLDSLENLKLVNDVVDQGSSMLPISFPGAEKFPRRLRKMTLSKTAFEWKYLSELGSLDELEVLKLEDNAFTGEYCDVSNVVFKKLQYLRIGRSSDLVCWAVSEDTFPVLKCLILRHCTMLDAVPSAFGEVESLKVMELVYTNNSVANSAREIHQQKCGGFQLSIHPPL